MTWMWKMKLLQKERYAVDLWTLHRQKIILPEIVKSDNEIQDCLHVTHINFINFVEGVNPPMSKAH